MKIPYCLRDFHGVYFRYDRPQERRTGGSGRVAAEPGRCPARPPPMRQDDFGPPVRAAGVAQLLRPGGSARSCPPCRARSRLASAQGAGGHRRDSASARSLPAVAGSGRPEAFAGTVPDSRQCLARLAETIVGESCRPAGNGPVGRLPAGRLGGCGARPTLAARRASVVLHGAPRERLAGMAPAVPADVSGGAICPN